MSTVGDGRTRYVTVPKLAREWGVSGETIRRLLLRGDMRGMRVGKSYVVLMASARNYENRSQVVPVPD